MVLVHKNSSNTAQFVVYTIISASNMFGKIMRKKGL